MMSGFAVVDVLDVVVAEESTTTGAVTAVEDVLVVSVALVLVDRVLWLQPLSASPARIKVNRMDFFIWRIELPGNGPRGFGSVRGSTGSVPRTAY